MKKQLLPVLLGMLVASASNLPGQMDVEDAIVRSLSHDPGIRKVYADVTDAEGFSQKTRADLLPQISVEGRAGAALRDTAFNQTQGQGDMLFSRSASIIGRQQLWNWNSDWYRYQDSKHRILAKENLDKEQRETTAFMTIAAYLDVIRARKQLELAEDSAEVHANIPELAEKRAAAAGNQADVELSKARYDLSRTLVMERRLSLRQAEVAFARWVGQRPPAHLTTPKTPRIASLGEIDPRKNFHYLATTKQHEAALLEKKSIERKFGPRFYLEASASVGQDVAGTRGRNNDASFMLVGTFDLFDGGRKKGELIQAIADVNRQLAITEETIVLLNEDIVARWEDYRSIGQRIATLKTYSGELAKTVALYREQFNLGTRPLLSLLDVQNELISASVRITDAQRDRTYLGYRLLYFGGRLLRETVGERYLTANPPSVSKNLRPISKNPKPLASNSFPMEPATEIVVPKLNVKLDEKTSNKAFMRMFRTTQSLRVGISN